MKVAIVMIALLCSLCQLLALTSAGKINSFQKTHITANGKSSLVLSLDGFNKGTLATASCDNQKTGSSKCNVQLTSYNPYRQRNCQVILDSATIMGRLGYDRLVPLGADKAIFLWTTPSDNLRLSVVHFDDNCKAYEAQVELPEVSAENMMRIVVVHENCTFDVSLKNPKLCGKDWNCRVRFDAKAQRIGEPVPWMSTIDSGFVFGQSAGNEGYFINKMNFDHSSTVSFVDMQGNERLMRSYPGNMSDDKNSIWQAMSWSHGLLTVCPERLGICEQFDLQNKTILAPVNVIRAPTLATDVHSLSHGGFLRFSEPTKERKEYRVTKYDSTGKEVGKIDIEGIGFEVTKYNPSPIVQMYKDKGGKHCVSIASAIWGSDGEGIAEILYNVACFDDKDFS